MVRILNANNIVEIISYFKKNQKELYFSKKLDFLFTENYLQLRNMIFNQYIIPVAEIIDSNISKLALFDFRYCNKYSELVVIMCGNINRDFLDECCIKLQKNDYSIKKMTVKFLLSDMDVNIMEMLRKENFDKELEVKMGNNTFYQFSLFYDLEEKGV